MVGEHSWTIGQIVELKKNAVSPKQTFNWPSSGSTFNFNLTVDNKSKNNFFLQPNFQVDPIDDRQTSIPKLKKPVFVNIAKASENPAGKLISKYIKVVVTYLKTSKQLTIFIADMVATIKSVDKY